MTTKARYEAIARATHAINDRFNVWLGTSTVESLRRIAMRIQRYGELQCNGIQRWDPKARDFFASWTETDDARYERLTLKALAEAQALVGDDLKVYHQSDPRGLQVYVYKPSALTGSIDSVYPQQAVGVPQ